MLANYDDGATIGVTKVAKDIVTAIKPIFRNNLFDLGPKSTVENITRRLKQASYNLREGGLCFFYFHGHGDSLPDLQREDELMDQALVCHDGYLLDDTIDEILAGFKPSHRVLTLVDSCSSETVIEWTKHLPSTYPQIIHIASSLDESVAYASPRGGILSRTAAGLLYNYGYSRLTYRSFIQRLKRRLIYTPCFERTTDNVTSGFLNARLFT